MVTAIGAETKSRVPAQPINIRVTITVVARTAPVQWELPMQATAGAEDTAQPRIRATVLTTIATTTRRPTAATTTVAQTRIQTAVIIAPQHAAAIAAVRTAQVEARVVMAAVAVTVRVAAEAVAAEDNKIFQV